jgi:alpha-L-arabinofuranosidase
MVTAMYSQHHGERLMEMKAEGVPTYAQNLRLEGIRPAPKVAVIDALATASDKAAYWHGINRSFDRALEVTVDFSALGPLEAKARLFVLEGRLDDEAALAAGEPIAKVREEAVEVKDGAVSLKLPARSVAVLEATRK